MQIPAEPSTLTFDYAGLSFDTANGDSINDAFEVALVDAQGETFVETIGADRDAFLNATETLANATAVGTSIGNGTATSGSVTLDISDVAPNSDARFIFRLLNNDSDRQTTVRLVGVNAEATTVSATGAATVAEGATYTLTVSASGSQASSISGWTVDWGDGTVESLSNPTPTATPPTHIYADNREAPYNLSLIHI